MWKLISLLILFIASTTSISASDYYVSTTGSDSNQGTSASPYKTISKGISSLNPGDKLAIGPGQYSSFSVTKSGTDLSPINIIAQNATISGGNTAINLSGSFINVSGFEVSGTSSHAVLISGKNISFKDFIVHDSVNENMGSNGSCSGSGGWGSGLKVMVGSENILLENGSIYRNCGEGLGITRGINVTARNLIAYDNFSVNFYLDNSRDVTLENSLTYCTNDTRYYRSGQPAAGILIGEESYSGWGAQLTNLKVINNLSHGCKGLSFYGAEVSPGGLKGALIAHNTIVSIYSGGKGISIATEPDNRDIKIINNIASGPITTGTGITASNNLTSTTFATTPNPNNPTSFMPNINSSAINQGNATIGIATDYSQNVRNNPPDIGALEFVDSNQTSPLPSPSSSPLTTKPGDFNHDNVVNFLDFDVISKNFNNPFSIYDYNLLISTYGT